MKPVEATEPVIKLKVENNETAINVIKSKARHTRMVYEDLVMVSDRGITAKLVQDLENG